MEDFHRAGGMPRLHEVLSPKLERSVQTATGRPLVRERTRPAADASHVVRTLEDPLGPAEALACIKGTLAPMGAVIKASAASSSLLRHRGPAIVFNSPQEAAVRLEDPDLNVTEPHILGLRNPRPLRTRTPEARSRAMHC